MDLGMPKRPKEDTEMKLKICTEFLERWFTGFCCLVGEEDRDWEFIESDPNWWEIYFWGNSLQN